MFRRCGLRAEWNHLARTAHEAVAQHCDFAKIDSLEQRPEARRSNHRGDFFQADDAGERAHFALLVLAELEQ